MKIKAYGVPAQLGCWPGEPLLKQHLVAEADTLDVSQSRLHFISNWFHGSRLAVSEAQGRL